MNTINKQIKRRKPSNAQDITKSTYNKTLLLFAIKIKDYKTVVQPDIADI